MKNKILKYYIVAIYLCSTVIMFAQPGATDDTGTLEGTSGDTTGVPIDDYIWIVAIVIMAYAFYKLKLALNTKIKD